MTTPKYPKIRYFKNNTCTCLLMKVLLHSTSRSIDLIIIVFYLSVLWFAIQEGTNFQRL